ncbi:MAG: tyrosine-type recombinase/integrase [Bdellovibrionaceae bacterium]|nr:tyrosine-type recombinase/integrase [Bdellovibrio sp.]
MIEKEQNFRKKMQEMAIISNKEDIAIIGSWLFQKGKKTQIYYRRIVKEFFNFYPNLSLRTTQITHLALFLKTFSDYSDATRNTYKNALSSLFTFSLKTGYIERNPALALDNLKTPDKIYSKVLSREQVERMIELEANPRNRLILKILYFTGVRVDEISHLKKSSFHSTENGLIMMVEGKGRKIRSIHLPRHLSDEILIYAFNIDSGDCLFTNDRRVDFGINDFSRTPISNSQIFRIVKAAAAKANLSVQPSPHWLRHTSATHAIEAGAPIHVVQRSLGHESISTTGKYLDIRPKESVGDYIPALVSKNKSENKKDESDPESNSP